jgi:hypothetical protein
VGLALQASEVDGVEGTHEANAGQEFGRSDPGPLSACLERHLAVALRIWIPRVEYDFSRELVREVASDLRERSVRNGDEHDVAEHRRLSGRSRPGLGPDRTDEIPELLGVAGRDEHLVPRLGPQRGERASNPPRADDADLERAGFSGAGVAWRHECRRDGEHDPLQRAEQGYVASGSVIGHVRHLGR